MKEQHQLVKDGLCAPPFSCVDEQVAFLPELTISCEGDAGGTDVEYFGLRKRNVQGRSVYADLLYAITDTPFLFRNGRRHLTPYWIDSATRTATVMLCFFTPQHGVATVLEISADFSRANAPVFVKTSFSHYAMLEGTSLALYIFVQSLCLINIIFMIFFVCQHIYDMLDKVRNKQELHVYKDIFVLIMDAASTLLVTAFVCIRLPTRFQSSAGASSVLGKLAALPWGDNTVEINDKKSQFFGALDELLMMIEVEKSLQTLGLVILFVCLLRIIACMDCHPRLALLTSTVANAFDDLRHSLLIIGLLISVRKRESQRVRERAMRACHANLIYMSGGRR